MNRIDWLDEQHWKVGKARPCVYCGMWTPLVDAHGYPAHSACHENASNAIALLLEDPTYEAVAYPVRLLFALAPHLGHMYGSDTACMHTTRTPLPRQSLRDESG